MADKENLQRQAAGHILEIDKLKQVCDHFFRKIVTFSISYVCRLLSAIA